MVSHDNDLFDQFSNIFVIAAINSFNFTVDRNGITENQFKAEMVRNTDDRNGYFYHFIKELTENCSMLVNKDKNGCLKLKSGSKLPVPVTREEKAYLKAILRSKYSRIFFNDDEIEKLISSCSDAPDIPLDDICVSIRNEREITDTIRDNIRSVLSSIKEHSEIRYSNKTKNGIMENMSGYPVRIEYSPLYDLFQVSIWSDSESRPVKVNIHTMYDLELTGNIWKDAKSPVEMMKTKRLKEPVIMKIRNCKNTAARANIMFSTYDTETIKLPDGNSLMKIYYYSFDEKEIIDRIFSFGPYIQVISPQSVVDKIIERLERAAVY